MNRGQRMAFPQHEQRQGRREPGLCEEVSRGAAVMVVVRIRDVLECVGGEHQVRECNAKKEPRAGGWVPGSCPGSVSDLLCDLGQVFSLSGLGFSVCEMLELD